MKKEKRYFKTIIEINLTSRIRIFPPEVTWRRGRTFKFHWLFITIEISKR